jgi:ribosomal protein S18 acetylase RimI-like enzyme
MELAEIRPEHHEGCLEVISSLPEWFGYPGALEGVASALKSASGFVATDAGKVAGFVAVAPCFEESLEITYLAVHAARRRQGIGRRLVYAARDLARTEGAGSLCLLTLGPSAESAAYAETVEFYRALGFLRIKELRLSDWNGAPALLMSAPPSSIA